MPGPVSDSYDPEFGTGANAEEIRASIRAAELWITGAIGSKKLKDILDVVRGVEGRAISLPADERRLRIIRFCLNRALETI